MMNATNRAMSLCIEDIPDLMLNKMKWPVAAAIQRKWFAGRNFKMTADQANGNSLLGFPPDNIVTDLVFMRWALGFQRVGTTLETLRACWHDPAAMTLLRQKALVEARNHPFTADWRFGNVRSSVETIYRKWVIQSRSYNYRFDDVDELHGAIGAFTLELAATGLVSRESGKRNIKIDGYCIFLRKTYHFNGQQALGVWGKDGVAAWWARDPEYALEEKLGGGRIFDPIPLYPRPIPGPEDKQLYSVSNKEYCDWRNASKKGGDLLLLSDAVQYNVSPAVVIALD